MRAPVLRRLEIAMDDLLGPINLLQFKHFSSTLTTLKLSSGELYFDNLPLNLVFPLLRDLDIRVHTTVPSPRIFRAFPNVKRMELREIYGPHEGNWDRLYGQSVDELAMYDGPRPSFDVVKGDCLYLDSCALYCPIKILLIDILTVAKVEHIVNLVQTCHVSTLRVELDGLEDCNKAFSHLSFELARIPVQTLKTLWVEIEFGTKDVDVLREVAVSHESPFPSPFCFFLTTHSYICSMWFQNVLPRRLAALRLESCSIHLRFFERYTVLSKSELGLDLFREFNWDQFAESVARLNPTLREIECQGSDLTRYSTTWTVKENGRREKKEGANEIDPFSRNSFRLEIEKKTKED
ncbi:hypothetical protein NLI96_g2862 [Meripilus lineatus]|uniref:Uncharacterized protein n=1 Tax=Meripilus lineatus TaxID=2056292 RepID=A0AAD5V7Z9_9APHY|nr:hypothetical protein NLI96_g2862 [Physisporinus lineatus]